MTRQLKDWLAAYMEYTKHSEAPDRYHFWTGVSTIAGALRRKVWIDEVYFKWYPNFYIVFVAPPGIVAKSTTINIGMSLLREIDGINFGPDSGTWQALVHKMSEVGEEFLANDGNYYPMSAITMPVGELGTFLDPQNSGQVDTMVDLWDGKGNFEKLTLKDGSISISAPWINLIACTTPSWIGEQFSDYFHGGGLSSRMVMIYAEQKRKLIAYPSRHVQGDMSAKREALINDLEQISSLAGKIELSKDAYEWGEAWYERHYQGMTSHLSEEKYLGYLARKQTHIHKLAIILAAAKRDSLIITKDELIRAEKEMNIIEEQMPLVFGKMDKKKEMQLAADIIRFLQKNGESRLKDVYRQFFNIPWDEFLRIKVSLENSGLAEARQLNNETLIKATSEALS